MRIIRRKDWLLWAAAVGLGLLAAGLITGGRLRARGLAETGKTRKLVAAACARFLPEGIQGPTRPALRGALGRLAKEPYVAHVWFVDPRGEVLYSTGGGIEPGRNVTEFARSGDEAGIYLAALPEGILSEEERLLFMSVGLVRRSAGGDHNDVWRPLVRPVRDERGNLLGVVAIAYEAADLAEAGPRWAYLLSLAATGLGFAAYWLSLPLWTWRDARTSGEPAGWWALFVLVANLAGLLAYLLVARAPGRPKRREG